VSIPVHSCPLLSTPVTFLWPHRSCRKNPCYNARMKDTAVPRLHGFYPFRNFSVPDAAGPISRPTKRDKMGRFSILKKFNRCAQGTYNIAPVARPILASCDLCVLLRPFRLPPPYLSGENRNFPEFRFQFPESHLAQDRRVAILPSPLSPLSPADDRSNQLIGN